VVVPRLSVCAVISIECMPEACVLVKGKPRVRMVPEKAAEADKAAQGTAAKEEALGSGTADPAADMFKSKVDPVYSFVHETSLSVELYSGITFRSKAAVS